MPKPRIGFLGLGAMGGAMARRLVQSGFTVVGYDVSDARAAAATREGVTVAKSPAAVADGAEVMLSSLPNPRAVRAAYLGDNGAVAAARAGTILVDLSTIDPATWAEVAEVARARGVDSLGAPVSGGPADAGSGKLVFLVGGDADMAAVTRLYEQWAGVQVRARQDTA